MSPEELLATYDDIAAKQEALEKALEPVKKDYLQFMQHYIRPLPQFSTESRRIADKYFPNLDLPLSFDFGGTGSFHFYGNDYGDFVSYEMPLLFLTDPSAFRAQLDSEVAAIRAEEQDKAKANKAETLANLEHEVARLRAELNGS